MKLYFLASLFVFVFSFNGSAADSAVYFRSQAVYHAATNALFDKLNWQIQLDGPIRSSVVGSGSLYFVSTAKGSVYAIDKMGKIKWIYRAGSAVNATIAFSNGSVYFTDNDQTLFCLSASTGKEKWKKGLGHPLKFEWGFDNYYSSPVIIGEKLVVGSADGNIYCFEKNKGSLLWQFNTGAVVRSTPSVRDGFVYAGDTEGFFYKIELQTAKLIWKSKTTGTGLSLARFGFDRKAIIATPTFASNICTIGSRDGFLYGINTSTGDSIWRRGYQMSWVISSAVVKDSFAIVGTSDGRYVNAVNLFTGKEKWRCNTKGIVWGSAILINDHVYIGDNEGIVYIIDFKNGKKLGEYRCNGAIMTTPFFDGSHLVFGNDDGIVYSLEAGSVNAPAAGKRYVFWQKNISGAYYKPGEGADVRLRDYLAENGFTVIDSTALINVMSSQAQDRPVIVWVTEKMPDTCMQGGKTSLIRRYLDEGGSIVFTAINPVLYDFTNPSLPNGLNADRAKLLLDIDYGPNDLRSVKGIYAAFPSKEGEQLQMPAFWFAGFAVPLSWPDKVLGTDEKGMASAWIKYYGKERKGRLIQVWANPSRKEDYKYIMQLADKY